ncbi:MAG: hypothetical protein AAFZ07_13380 [Actinomycetota bacterium]
MDTGEAAIELRVPAAADSIRYARLLASAVGDDAGFDVEQVDDLKIAIDELCVAVFDGAATTGPLTIAFRNAEGAVEIIGSCAITGDFDEPDLDGGGLQARILRAVADEVMFTSNGDRAGFVLRKRR